MKINDNVEKINECATDIINISREFNTLMDDLYENIRKIKDTSEISEESSFGKLLDKISSEKNIYTNYGTNINRLGNTLLEYSVGIKNILLEKGIKGNTLLYDGDKITNDVIPPIPDINKFIASAKNCVNEIRIDYDCGQYTIGEDINQILKRVEEYNTWNVNTRERYTKVLDDLNSSLKQIKIEQIKKRVQNINII